ncbi:hypothetical protein BUGL105410_15240 [Burkholderia gladioli]
MCKREAEWKRGRIDVAQHLAEERFVSTGGQPQPRVRDQVAIGLRFGKKMSLPVDRRLDFLVQDREGGMIADEVMKQHDRLPAPSRLFGKHEAQQRRLRQVHPVARRMDAILQLLRDCLTVAVEDKLAHLDTRLPQDDLHRRTQPVPQYGGAQDVVPFDETRYCVEVAIERRAIGKGQMRAQQIGIALRAENMVKQDAVLQRRKRVDVLDVRDTAWNLGHDAIDIGLRQIGERQEIGRDDSRVGADPVLRNHDFTRLTERGGKRGKCRLLEQVADGERQADLAQTLDKLNGQQRVATEHEEVIVPAHALDAE